MIKQSVLLTFNSLLVSTEKGQVFVWWTPELQCFCPMLGNAHALQFLLEVPTKLLCSLLQSETSQECHPLPPPASYETLYHMDWGIWRGMRYRNLSAASKLFPWKGPQKGNGKNGKEQSTLFNTFQALMGEKKAKDKRKKKSSTNNSVFSHN